jgi:hypothetical protein
VRILTYVKIVKRNNIQAGMVAHACNSSYSRDRDWEDHGSRSAWAKTGDPIPKIMKAKIAGGHDSSGAPT